jgi:uncharacterized protein YndB with AHSA1/START domain
MANHSPTTKTGDLVITRTFDAPRALVWKAWTDPQHVMRWWGPAEFTAPAAQIDLRVGGKYLFCMKSAEAEYWNAGTYLELVPPERLVYNDTLSDSLGNPVPGSYYGMEGDVVSYMMVTVTLEDVGGKTRMTIRHRLPDSEPLIPQMYEGWNGSFDKLAASLK